MYVYICVTVHTNTHTHTFGNMPKCKMFTSRSLATNERDIHYVFYILYIFYNDNLKTKPVARGQNKKCVYSVGLTKRTELRCWVTVCKKK